MRILYENHIIYRPRTRDLLVPGIEVSHLDSRTIVLLNATTYRTPYLGSVRFRNPSLVLVSQFVNHNNIFYTRLTNTQIIRERLPWLSRASYPTTPIPGHCLDFFIRLSRYMARRMLLYFNNILDCYKSKFKFIYLYAIHLYVQIPTAAIFCS